MFRKALKNVIKTQKYFRNLSDNKEPLKFDDFTNKNFNTKFEYEYIRRLESIEDGLRFGIFFLGCSIGLSGYLVRDAIKSKNFIEVNLRNFYGFSSIKEAIENLKPKKEDN